MAKETYSQRKVRALFKNIFTFKKVICYRNPCDAKKLFIEQNGNGDGIIWGRPKGKPNRVKFGKVFFGVIPLAYGLSVLAYIDALTHYVFALTATVGAFSLIIAFGVGFICYSPFFLAYKRAIYG
jgi:hypothetical protein